MDDNKGIIVMRGRRRCMLHSLHCLSMSLLLHHVAVVMWVCHLRISIHSCLVLLLIMGVSHHRHLRRRLHLRRSSSLSLGLRRNHRHHHLRRRSSRCPESRSWRLATLFVASIVFGYLDDRSSTTRVIATAVV